MTKINFQNRKAAQEVIDNFESVVANIKEKYASARVEYETALKNVQESENLSEEKRESLTGYITKSIEADVQACGKEVTYQEIVYEQACLVIQRKRKLKLDSDLSWAGL